MTLPPAAGQGIGVNHEVLNDVYRRLAAELEDLEAGGSGTLKFLQQHNYVALNGNQLGHFPAAEGQGGADGFAASCRNAYQQISSTYSKFLSAYEELIKVLKKSADNHAEAEHASTQAVNNVYPGSSSPPTGAQYFG